MKGWKYSQHRKVHQRALNKYVRAINENIKNDELWRGRFYLRQKEFYFYSYEDHSGWYGVVVLEAIDLKTGQTKEICSRVNELIMWEGHDIWLFMNNFIVEDCDVWGKEGHEALRADKKVYR